MQTTSLQKVAYDKGNKDELFSIIYSPRSKFREFTYATYSQNTPTSRTAYKQGNISVHTTKTARFINTRNSSISRDTQTSYFSNFSPSNTTIDCTIKTPQGYIAMERISRIYAKSATILNHNHNYKSRNKY